VFPPLLTDLSSRIHVATQNGFINVTLTDRDWVASMRPPEAQRALPTITVPQFQMAAIGTIQSCFPEKHGLSILNHSVSFLVSIFSLFLPLLFLSICLLLLFLHI
jgi:hypothetical protein